MPPRKRVRKRKRRNVSSSESDSDSSSSSSSEDEQKKVQVKGQPVIPAKVKDTSSDSDPNPDSDSSTSSNSSSPSNRTKQASSNPGLTSKPSKAPIRRPPPQPPSRSPTPPSTAIPSLLPHSTANVPSENEKALKEKFRTFWMSSVADAFKDDLEEIRKESNMTTSRLSLLIDSLASGADVFSSTMPSGETAVNEMEVVLGST
ncbi:hypothetical protein BU17DRAFT_54899 [Hysterangium stoloniferum]|nr:hypothetical protein BU17DRAFT_54899 [Hysterangium stoloniferum]